MAKFYAMVICVFLIAECCLFIDSKKSEILHKRTGRVDTVRRHENHNEQRSFLSSSTAKSEQIDVGSIEDKVVTAAKSSTDVENSAGFGVDDEEADSSGEGQQRGNSFDSVVEYFDASVNRLKRKILRSGDFTLYSSSQKPQRNDSGVARQDNKTVSPSVASESSTKSVLRLSVIAKAAISSTQAIVSSSTAELAILPTQASSIRIIQETAGVLKSVGSVSVAVEATTTPSPTAAVFSSDGNILPTVALAVSPVLEAVTWSTDKEIQPHTSSPVSHSATATAEEKPTSGINIPTTNPVPQTENTTSKPLTKELSPSEPTEPTTGDGETEVQGKNKGGDPPGEKKTGLFRSLSIEILIALVAGALCALLLVAFLVYRLKKRNEGSYELSETINMKVRTHDDLGMKKEVFV